MLDLDVQSLAFTKSDVVNFKKIRYSSLVWLTLCRSPEIVPWVFLKTVEVVEDNNQRVFLCWTCLDVHSETEWIVETEERVFLSAFSNVDLCIRAPALEISAVSTRVLNTVIKCWV